VAGGDVLIGLVHLVWAPLGPAPLRDFLRSYDRFDAGAEHELVILLNGLGAAGAHPREELLGELAERPHRLIELPVPVQDLDAYSQAAAQLDHDALCFLNSYAAALADGWVGHLQRALQSTGVGIAGATGNWESQAEWPRGAITHWPRELLLLARTRREFPRFPNPHIRTSSFVIERRRLLDLALPPASDKRAAYVIESGFQSITRKVQAQGLRAVVVDRDGLLYDPDDWPASATFRSGGQARLLIADNQTRAWEEAPPAVRAKLTRDSWGPEAASG
jgi:hypothetical protein